VPTASALQCFGKLPIAGDFIRFRLGAEEGKALAAWMEKGQGHAQFALRNPLLSKGAAGAAPRRYRFALDQGSGRRIVVGILHESHDRGKLRRFPFAFFTEVEASGFRSRPGLLPILLKETWESLESLSGLIRDAKGVDALLKELESVQISSPEPSSLASQGLESALQGSPAAGFWKNLFGAEASQRKLLLFDVLVRALGPSTKVKPEEAPAILKLPLAGTPDEVTVQCAFWIELVGGILRGARKAPSVFLAAHSEPASGGSVHIFFHRPDEKSFAALMTQHYEAEYVDDLTGKLSYGRSGPVLGPSSRQLLENPGASLRDLARASWIG
jgi:type VI secretion system ImpM family protein